MDRCLGTLNVVAVGPKCGRQFGQILLKTLPPGKSERPEESQLAAFTGANGMDASTWPTVSDLEVTHRSGCRQHERGCELIRTVSG